MFTSEVIASLNDLETDIYNYIVTHEKEVTYMRIRELADETHVSTATILRFCKKVGCEGFSEFKTTLKIDLAGRNQTVKSGDHAVFEFFERTLSSDQQALIDSAIHLLTAADSVLFLGIGSSGILAEYGARYFSSLGKFSMYIKDFSYPIHNRLQKNSVSIVLSVSGENSFSIKHINKLKREGSKIISITNHKHSTIAKMSDVNIAYYMTEEYYEDTNITTQVPVIYILETLARTLNQHEQA
ncbi:RpiR family transcriptional regulator [Streptohalobacillus salinus]|uniref:RpiR family transcriptional regulator n=1 Tax=Streptohalobacillus salinus TaxID=621096 RepID=A0A2V3W0B0_9BACI|nr:MurR/RpiR family transcriptional regulator [Streptohalobacillus salinus]PXW87330.1 RpiR family transcriptional regulator [Streptohalobacillus salinus]